ncbi:MULTISPECIES: hypothetical protein [unclassified Clostridioides]|uniref:hypothetical protein n=1 Tax=unclassified Clostridioides TaxID=2635829 RepID=UPI001D0FA47A|nr:hypothetical protein [Clostridioides sp. ES-S-0145-01]MCC0681840.1 hypothetical protein [Clostridioides sp. ES-S-0005-03]MCC0709262.1 hypothetical protein [Clostridioides sp. ES-S-0190-01]UDN64037.1 hypothetical protein IC758_20835 [Clostridioides sp. ES-W-0016-02]
MNSLVTENHGEIISYYDYQNKVLISTICILEVYFSKITNKHLIHLNCRRKEDVTLAQLSLIYESYFHKNSGMKGICWEYYIFNSIKNKNFYIQGLINEAINLLSFENTFDNIDAILWAGERTDLSVDYIKTLLSNENTIWSLNNQYNFKNHIDCVYNSFHLKKHRQNLPNNISGIWKTDLFVKKENSSTWYATTVKWNTNQMKCYNGLSIGISFDPAEKLYNRYYLDIQKK